LDHSRHTNERRLAVILGEIQSAQLLDSGL